MRRWPLWMNCDRRGAVAEELGSYSRQRVARVAEGLLQSAGVVGELPTPLEPIRRSAGIQEVLDISDLPEEMAAKKPPRWKRILGAMLFAERVTFIDRSEQLSRVNFTDAHETIHAACPWHEPILRLDNEDTLEGGVKENLELEANFGAARVIFQGNRFFRRALEHQVSIATPLAVADEYGASSHATLHYYSEGHPDAVALIVAGRYPYADGSVPIWRIVRSEPFDLRFGNVLHQFAPGGRMQLRDVDSPFGDICQRSRSCFAPPSKEITLSDRGGREHAFHAEAFYNQRCQFVMVVENKARRLGRRARLERVPALAAV